MTQGTCPVCNGTTRTPADGYLHTRSHISGYDRDTDTVPCTNCGGQYMFGKPRGTAPLRSDGTPCQHDYASSNAGRCLTNYRCRHCGDTYQIDSGD